MARRYGKMCSHYSVASIATAALTLYFVQLASAGETVTYLHADLAGSAALATDANGIQIWKETYRPYGDQLIDSTAAQNNNQWFAGKPFEDSTGLSYVGTRYYDPTLGRFMGIDPARFDLRNQHSFNRYAYAANNPYKYVDPDGREIRQQTHYVAETGNHTKITIIPNNQERYANDERFTKHPRLADGRLYATIGAGPEGGLLVGRPNRDTDLTQDRNTTDQLLTLPPGKSEDEIIEELFAKGDAYDDDLDYALWPSSWADGRNSNSYALGLLHAVGFRHLKVPPATLGWDKLLDDSYFRHDRATVTITDCNERPCKP